MKEEYDKKQMSNRKDAQKAANDLIDCFIKADSQFKKLICEDIITLFLIKGRSDNQLNNFINNNMAFRNLLNLMNIHS